MDACGYCPDTEACHKNDRKWKLLFEADERYKIEKDARQDSPERAPGKRLHDTRVAPVFQIYPDKNQRPGKRHGGYEPGRRGKPLSDCRGGKNDCNADKSLDENLQCFLPVLDRGVTGEASQPRRIPYRRPLFYQTRTRGTIFYRMSRAIRQ